ncbi:co-chaperone HscB [Thaumasiovibrio subtropicus]|uniref:co-chaperone HscB n=1 Tax=Thaumasiovibrio subtropicus TaxID=1891207 RepID=UPI000B35EE3C|nr:co-chaperone HscB [Thaumasiovibrio subtropicus]
MNHFELFGLPCDFNVDGNLLSERFRELQRQFHPDKFATASERDRLMAVQKAAEINDAFQTLKLALPRAEYLLLLQGIELRAEQQTMQDPEFLMAQMELREELEDIPASADPDTALAEFDDHVQALYRQQEKHFVELYHQGNWEEAADVVRRLKFVVKLQEEVERLEDTLLG